jgi:hypothetical protein
MIDDIDQTHEDVAPRDAAPYLGRPKKPRPKPELFRPVKLPGTEWKRGHARFDQTKRIWVPVKGHWAKIPKRRGFGDTAQDPGMADGCRRSRLRAGALEILWEAFCPPGATVGDVSAEHADYATENSDTTRSNDDE